MYAKTDEEESIAEFLGTAFAGKVSVSLNEIIQLLQADDEWCDWWKFHQKDWETAGWKKEQLIFVEDFPLLFFNHGDLPTAAVYQFQITTPELNRKKIDATGFKWFPCASVTSKLLKYNTDLWKKLYDRLNECSLITEYFKLLPPESWHLTIVSLYTPEIIPESGVEWLVGLHKQLDIKKIQNILDEEACEPVIAISKTHALGILLLRVELDEASAKSIKSLSKALGKPYNAESHISFAYQYKSASVTTLNAIAEAWKTIVDELLKDSKLILDRPKAGFFERMDLLHDSPEFKIEEQDCCFQPRQVIM